MSLHVEGFGAARALKMGTGYPYCARFHMCQTKVGAKMQFTETDRDFPKSAGMMFGLGLGGFFDGIVLHQLLQWHHMLTSFGYPADNVRNLEINTLRDGIFHSSTYFLIWGALMLAGGWFLLKGGEQERLNGRFIVK